MLSLNLALRPRHFRDAENFLLYDHTNAVSKSCSHGKYTIPMVRKKRFPRYTTPALGSESCLKPQSERTSLKLPFKDS